MLQAGSEDEGGRLVGLAPVASLLFVRFIVQTTAMSFSTGKLSLGALGTVIACCCTVYSGVFLPGR